VLFRILGPLEVCGDEGWTAIGAPKWRALLAALLLRPGQAVPAERLVGELWGGDPPPGARKLVSGYVSRLRRLIGDPDGRMLVTRSPGYQLLAARGALDASRFEELSGAGGNALAGGDTARAAALLGEALALWRGPALADVPQGPIVAAEADRLEEFRLTTLELRIEADMACGRGAGVVAELRGLTAEHPLRERLWGELMRALEGSGRPAEALEVYAHARQAIADELGADPGPDLQRLHQRLLTGGPAPGGQQAAAGRDRVQARGPRAAGVPADVPRQLPAAVRHFAGREEELARLTGLLDDAAGGTVVISAIDGTAGVGKTALAVHWAHRNADKFPDGQLYVNLRGFDPSGTPTTAERAVRGFLGALAVPHARIPDDLDAQVALYRSRLAGRRMLVVLDNARDADHVRPLLPGTARCPVLVTSRNQLASLVAVDGAVPLTVGLLTQDESRQLLSHRLGRERVCQEEQAAGELIELCARLPLALNITAARAVLRPGQPLAELVSELRDTRKRLDALRIGDSSGDLRAVFSWSCRTLGAEAARMFRLLGLHPGPDVSVPAAASLTAAGHDRARQALHELTVAHLLTEHTTGRYTCHDLLRAFAIEQAHIHDTGADRRAAQHRMLDHYLRTGHAAFTVLYPGWSPLELPPPLSGVTPEVLADQDRALTWYEAEHPVLVAIVAHAAEAGFDSFAWQIPCGLGTIMNRRAYWRDWIIVSETALAAAGRSGDLTGQAHSHHRLGQALLAHGSYPEAQAHLRQALALFGKLEDPARQGDIHVALSAALCAESRFADALTCARQALEVYRGAGHVAGQAVALNNIGSLEAQLGQPEQALTHCRQAFGLAREVGDREYEAGSLDGIGLAQHQLGRHAEAVAAYDHALRLWRAIGDRYNYAGTLTRLGDAYDDAAGPGAARRAWREALAILDEMDHPSAAEIRGKLRTMDARGEEAARDTGSEPLNAMRIRSGYEGRREMP
jgi:DNA-binding SARP family transcriptional activator/tetratricopeptide (TPR) repeat protein